MNPERRSMPFRSATNVVLPVRRPLITTAAGSLIITGLLGATAVGAQPLGREIEEPKQRVLARAGAEVITVEAFEQEMVRRSAGDPGRFDTPEEKQDLLDALLRRAAAVDAAKTNGYLQREDVRRAVDRIVFNRFLATELEQRLDALPPVTRSEIEAYYQANAEKYSRPERLQGALIHLEISSTAPEATRNDRRAKAEALLRESLEQANTMPHFGDLARMNSDDRASRYRGGVIGWLTRHPSARYKWPDEVVDALFSIPSVGAFAPLVETDRGFYLVRLVDREPSQPRSLDALADGIRRQLEETRRAEERDRFFEELLQGRDVVIDSDALESTTVPSLIPERPESPGSDGDTLEDRP